MTFQYEEGKIEWFTDGVNTNRVNTYDVSLLRSIISTIIFDDCEKINKLTKYLRNIAKICNALNLPITWNLPSGLKISQSYLTVGSKDIRPFSYSKTKLTLSIVRKNEFDKNKQITALMPNLIYSLDANTFCTLYQTFSIRFNNPQFFSVHDCFATTFDKVFLLKTILASVYTDIYTNKQYLLKFDQDIINLLKDKGVSEIVSIDTFNKLATMKKINSYKELDNNKILVTFIDKLDSDVIKSHNLDIVKLSNVHKDREARSIDATSVVISAAVTAYARIHMSKLKLDIFSKKGNIYYTDTDSIVCDTVCIKFI